MATTITDVATSVRSHSVRSHIVIPARLESTRLPRKLLLCETGKPLIQHTYEAASLSGRAAGICVAVDHPLLADAVRGFGGQVMMTDPAASSGTDRVAEVARRLPDVDIVVNVQGDEPEIAAAAIDLAIGLLEQDPSCGMATLATPLRCRAALEDPACVKVVMDARGRAMYFSRSPIPHGREWDDALLNAEPPVFHQHIGLYAYRREFLLRLSQMPPSPLEQVEKLEQLRVLQAGFPIRVGVIEQSCRGIDTADDYRAFVSRARNC